MLLFWFYVWNNIFCQPMSFYAGEQNCFSLLQIANWTFCETGSCNGINADNKSLAECQSEREEYTTNDDICQRVIEVTVSFTKSSADEILTCSCGKTKDFAPQCTFGEHYSVTYSEIVSIHVFSFLTIVIIPKVQTACYRGREKFLLIVRLARICQFFLSLR